MKESWTYNQITAQAEKTIAECMDRARPQQPGGEVQQQQIEGAFGVYMLLANLTSEHRTDQRMSDRDRLGELVRELDTPDE